MDILKLTDCVLSLVWNHNIYLCQKTAGKLFNFVKAWIKY